MSAVSAPATSRTEGETVVMPVGSVALAAVEFAALPCTVTKAGKMVRPRCTTNPASRIIRKWQWSTERGAKEMLNGTVKWIEPGGRG